MSVYLTRRRSDHPGRDREDRQDTAKWMKGWHESRSRGDSRQRAVKWTDSLYDCVFEAVEVHGANTTVLFTPASYTKDAS